MNKSTITKTDIQMILNDDWLLMDDCEGLKNGDVVKMLARLALSAMGSEPVVPDDVLAALQKVARIRLDLNGFDGDRRGIADCLWEAEEALLEVVKQRAAMLQAEPVTTTNKLGNSPVIPDGLIAAVNRLLDSDGSRGCYSAIQCGDAHDEIERLLAAAPQEVK